MSLEMSLAVDDRVDILASLFGSIVVERWKWPDTNTISFDDSKVTRPVFARGERCDNNAVVAVRILPVQANQDHAALRRQT